jgi:hypothetical protein
VVREGCGSCCGGHVARPAPSPTQLPMCPSPNIQTHKPYSLKTSRKSRLCNRQTQKPHPNKPNFQTCNNKCASRRPPGRPLWPPVKPFCQRAIHGGARWPCLPPWGGQEPLLSSRQESRLSSEATWPFCLLRSVCDVQIFRCLAWVVEAQMLSTTWF